VRPPFGRGADRPEAAGFGAAGERIAQAPRARWDLALVWFMRLAALAWLAKGVAHWAYIVGALPDTPAFDAAPVGRQSAVVYFGVVDCIAAVGLWLASAWGGVVWLFAATSAIILAVFAPDLAPLPPLVLALCAGSIVVYFILSWLASRERQ
jgi:hypothetical protein